MEAIMSRNLSSVVESCEERLKEGLERTLARVLKWTLHPTEEDAINELSRAELVFLMAVSALAHLDTEMSSVLLREVDRWAIFPRITNYMSGKPEAEWKLPRDIIDRASKFACILKRSGLFTVPPELCPYLEQLVAKDEGHHAGADNNSLEGAAGGSVDASVVEESSVRGQASGGEPQQEKRYRLEEGRKKRSRKQGGRRQEKKRKQQLLTLQPLQNICRSIVEPTPGPSKVNKEEAQRQLWEGVRKDDGQQIEGAVLCGADLEEEGEDSMTALTLAAKEGRLEAVRALLSLGTRLEE